MNNALLDKIKYAHRFAKRDDLYDSQYVEKAINDKDTSIQDLEDVLKYVHRFAKRDSSYDADWLQENRH